MKRTFVFGGLASLVVFGCSMTPVSDEATGSTSQAIGSAIYVDCAAGYDLQPGTAWAPVQTIRRAMALVQSGGMIYIRPGVCTERVDVTKSNILITRDPATPGVVEVAGNTPLRLDYTNLAVCDPGPAGYGHNRACSDFARDRLSTFDLYDVHDVTIRGLTITQDQNVYCPAATATSGCKVDSVTPTGLQQSVQAFGPYYQQSCILEGNTCEERPTPNAGYTGLKSGCCIIPQGSGSPQVVCNAPAGSQSAPNVMPPHVCGRPLVFISGVSIQGASYAIRIENNDITRIKRGDRTKWITAALPIFLNSRESDAKVIRDVHINGNTLHDLVAHDIDGNTFGGLLITASDNVDGFEVGNNVITDVGGAISPNGNYAWAQSGGSPKLTVPFDRVRNSWIHDNAITRTSNYAIYLDGPRRALVERNRIIDSWAGIGVVTEVRNDVPYVDKYGNLGVAPTPGTLTSDVWLRDNVVASTGAFVNDVNAFQGLAVGMWLTAPDRPHYNPVKNVVVTNNTFALTDVGDKAPMHGNAVNMLPGIQGESTFIGNIVAHTLGDAAAVYPGAGTSYPSTATYSWNVYWATSGFPLRIDGAGSTPAMLGDVDGLVTDPLFATTTSPNPVDAYHLQSTSPARDRMPTGASLTPSWAVGAPFTSTELDGYGGPRQCGSRDVGGDEYTTFKLCGL